MNPIIATESEFATDSSGDAPWTLTQRISPRDRVRVSALDASTGQALNVYPTVQVIGSTQPETPWAVYLAGPDGHYRLLCFDLDTKSRHGRDRAAVDADQLAQLLSSHGCDVVVCESGPSGGRHVWTALAEGVDAETVAKLARLARHLCPTLDLAPLSNPTTGCVRPPGAPHRAGGRSQVLSGDPESLAAARTTTAQVHQVIGALAHLVTDLEPTTVEPGRPLPLDDHGRLYLPGPRRPLPTTSRSALDQDAAAGDASAVLWSVLIGAASAHWHHSDVAALVDTAPGLEHVRSARERGRRVARRPAESAAILRRQWDKAVRWAAAHPRRAGDDPTFDDRAGAIAALVRQVQQRADTARGRWTTGAGPADRRILDAVCLLALQGVVTAVEADIRRLALLAGVGRETARVALHRLAADGWLSLAAPAHGCHGASWSIGTIHSFTDPTRSQADPRPQPPHPPTGAADRVATLAVLLDRTTAATHDTFTTAPGLGLYAGTVYAAVGTAHTTPEDLAHRTGIPTSRARRDLDRLAAAGVLVKSRSGWRRASRTTLDRIAKRRGVAGRLDQRAQRYAIEREAWAWWQAEAAWMCAPRRPGTKQRPQRGQLALIPETGTHAYGPHPRRADGSLSWREARRTIEAERDGRAHRSIPKATTAQHVA